MNKINLSIEARMTSSRLPGKVLMDIGGKPALDRMLERIKINFHNQQIDVFDYSEPYTPPYLYIKSRFMNEEAGEG